MISQPATCQKLVYKQTFTPFSKGFGDLFRELNHVSRSVYHLYLSEPPARRSRRPPSETSVAQERCLAGGILLQLRLGVLAEHLLEASPLRDPQVAPAAVPRLQGISRSSDSPLRDLPGKLERPGDERVYVPSVGRTVNQGQAVRICYMYLNADRI